MTPSNVPRIRRLDPEIDEDDVDVAGGERARPRHSPSCFEDVDRDETAPAPCRRVSRSCMAPKRSVPAMKQDRRHLPYPAPNGWKKNSRSRKSSTFRTFKTKCGGLDRCYQPQSTDSLCLIYKPKYFPSLLQRKIGLPQSIVRESLCKRRELRPRAYRLNVSINSTASPCPTASSVRPPTSPCVPRTIGADRPAGHGHAVIGRPAGARGDPALVIVSRRLRSTTVRSAS